MLILNINNINLIELLLIQLMMISILWRIKFKINNN